MNAGTTNTNPSERSRRIGVLVMAYGTPSDPGQIESYYTHIRRGRPPTPEQLADLIRRYDAIGGVSPMRERTESQLNAIRDALEATGTEFVVTLGHKHAEPFIEDGVSTLISEGADVVVGLVLAPHYSVASVGQYHQRAVDALGTQAAYRAIDDWSTEAALIDFTTNSIREQLVGMPGYTTVVFTAHSLPERVLATDPYRERLMASATAIAGNAALGSPPSQTEWRLGWQSAGRTPEPWAGPDILEIIEELAGDPTSRSEGVLVVPQGFTSDHLEILYDLDIEARNLAQIRGLAFARTDAINADPTVMAALAKRIVQAAS